MKIRLVCMVVVFLTIGLGTTMQTFAQGGDAAAKAQQEARQAYERQFTAKEQWEAAEKRAAEAERKNPDGIDAERARQGANQAHDRYDRAVNEARELRERAREEKANDNTQPRGPSGVVDPDIPRRQPRSPSEVIDPRNPRQPAEYIEAKLEAKESPQPREAKEAKEAKEAEAREAKEAKEQERRDRRP